MFYGKLVVFVGAAVLLFFAIARTVHALAKLGGGGVGSKAEPTPLLDPGLSCSAGEGKEVFFFDLGGTLCSCEKMWRWGGGEDSGLRV